MQRLRMLDLFSGIGGFSLGLERAGMRTVAFCEIEPFCRAVLKKHWPHVPCYEDVRTLTAERLSTDGIAVDVICGGFPCQDISVAGKGAGIEGARSGLWSEYRRLIGELRPRYVIVENVAALLGRGMDKVLGDLAALRFDAEWHCIPASAISAPHRRDRLWIVAYSASERQRHRWSRRFACEHSRVCDAEGSLADAGSTRLQERPTIGGRLGEEIGRLARVATERCSCAIPDADSQQTERSAKPWCERHPWFAEPNVGRVADGVSCRVDRLKSLGNAVVPQIPEIIGRAILAAEGR